MKKVLALVLVLLIFAFPAIAEETQEGSEIETLTVENCDDLAALLALKNEFDPSIAEFAEKYKGQIIEFDAWIGDLANHGNYNTRYDILICHGDYTDDNPTISGPYFRFEDVGVRDLGLSGLWLPDFVTMGANIHVIAEVEAFNKMTGLFELDPVLIEQRELQDK